MQILISKDDLSVVREALMQDAFNDITIANTSHYPPDENRLYVNLENCDTTDIYLIGKWVSIQDAKNIISNLNA